MTFTLRSLLILVAAIGCLCGVIGYDVGASHGRAWPTFETGGDKNIAIDKETGRPVLIIERDWSNTIHGPTWHYTVVLSKDYDRDTDGDGVKEPHISWMDECELLVPDDHYVARAKLRETLGDCVVTMDCSSPDRHKHEHYRIHIAERGFWSLPIKDGQVVMNVEAIEKEPAQ